MSQSIKLFMLPGNYVAVEIEAEKSIELIKGLQKLLGKGGEDVDDAIRMIKHFNEFYSLMQRKFKDFLTPRKSISDLIKENVLVDKIKLSIKDGKKIVVIVFDKSITLPILETALAQLGYTVEKDTK
ncbi:MAG: hypothetical protein JHC33_04105 [Ignisphaera sp.]|nr:hypothetical protein [Ignisphaera sp.]